MWRGRVARAGCSTSANPRPATSRAVDGAAGSHLEPTHWQQKAGPPQADKAAPVDLLLRPPECVPPRSEPEPETFVVAAQGEPILPTMWFGVCDFLPVCNCDRSAVCRRWHRSENQWHRWSVVLQVFSSWSHLLSMKLYWQHAGNRFRWFSFLSVRFSWDSSYIVCHKEVQSVVLVSAAAIFNMLGFVSSGF